MKEIGEEVPEADALSVRLLVTEEIVKLKVGLQPHAQDNRRAG